VADAHSAGAFRQRLAVGSRALEAQLVLTEGGRLEGLVREGAGTREVGAQVGRAADGAILLRLGGRLVRARVVRQGDVTHVVIGGRVIELRDAERARPGHATGEEPHATSPMTGLIAKVTAVAGAEVPAGGPLFVVEAMKMEYVVRAPRAVRVAEVKRKAGEKVALGEVVVTFVPAARQAEGA
jgi:3-methylcrotonyl-CoA carboxylase alpha subunit